MWKRSPRWGKPHCSFYSKKPSKSARVFFLVMSILFLICWCIGLSRLVWFRYLKKINFKTPFFFLTVKCESGSIHRECLRISGKEMWNRYSFVCKSWCSVFRRRSSLLALSVSDIWVLRGSVSISGGSRGDLGWCHRCHVLCAPLVTAAGNQTCVRVNPSFLNRLEKMGQHCFQAFCWRRLNRRHLDVWFFFSPPVF